MSALRRATSVAVLLAAASALTACGTVTAPAVPEPAMSASSAAAAGPKVGDTVPLTDLSAASNRSVSAKKTTHITMSFTGTEQGTYEADVDYRGKNPSVSMEIAQGGQTVDVLFVGGVLFVGSDGFAAQADGKRWIKVDPDGDDAMSKAMGPFLTQMETAFVNPAEQLKGYDGVDATVTAVEADRVTYTVTLTTEQLRAAVKQGAAPGLDEAALAQLPDGITYEMTLDAAMLPVSMSMDLAGQSMTVEYSDWGRPVTIAAPKKSEIGTVAMP
ncbi:MAG: hypothetical protein ACRCYR_19960 [Phycicoccus sp.]